MGVSDSIKGFYFSLEDKYYSFLDWLDSRGIGVYKLVDAVENSGLPSFPFALILLLLIISGIWMFLLPMVFAPQNVLVTIAVSDFADNAAIENTVVTVSFEEKEQFGTTNSLGEKGFSLPVGKEVTVKAEKDAYKPGQTSFIVSKTETIKIISLERLLKTIKKSIQILEAQTGALVDKEITVRFSCSNARIGELTVKTIPKGEAEIDVPEDCGTLTAELLGTGAFTNTLLDPLQAVSVLQFQEKIVQTGSVDAIVKDEKGNAVAGAKVRLLTADKIEANAAYTGASGGVRFDGIPTGTYFVVVHDDFGKYKTFDGSGEKKSVIAEQTTQFNVTLQQAIVGKIKVIVKDTTSLAPIQNALVSLQRDNILLDSIYTSAEGRAEFNVTENIAFDVIVDHPEYLIAVLKNVLHKETENEVLLKRATADIANKLFVRVTDKLGKPVENAKLLLKKTDGTVVVSGIATGADGQAEFPNLPTGESFTVFAVKQGFTGKESEQVTIRARQENRVTIVLDIGTGVIQLQVIDETGSAVQGAEAKAIEIGKTTPLLQQITDLDGKTSFVIRADLDVYFTLTATGFLPYTTSRVPVQEGVTVEKTIKLSKAIDKVQVEFLGLFVEDSIAASTLAAGQAYTAKLLLKLPTANAPFAEAGIHFRTGQQVIDATSIVEEDSLFITDVRAGTTSIIKGASFTPPKGFSIDSRRFTSGNSKWADIVWKQPGAGVFEAEAVIIVRDNALLGEQLELWYRGWSKKDTFDRAPIDAELGTSGETSNKQALYANALLAQYSVGPSNLCRAGFCKSYTIEDLATGSRTFVIDFFPATVSKDYRLGFRISKITQTIDANAEIVFTAEQQGLRFGAFSITGADGKIVSGNPATSEARAGIGSLGVDSAVFGTIDFRTIKDGLNTLRIRILSGQREVFNEIIDVVVEPALALQLEVIPKEIIPLIDNDLLLRVKDEEGKVVANALVKVFLNNTLISSRETNPNGEATIRIQAPSTGSTVKIVAQKLGFKEAELTIPVDDSILLVTPPEINTLLTLTDFFKEVDIVAKNRTAKILTIGEMKFTDSFEQLATFKLNGNIVGQDLQVDADTNFTVQIELTDTAFQLKQPKSLKGEMSISVFNTDINKTFLTKIPINLRIGLGEEVGNINCLVVDPATIQFFSDVNDEAVAVKLSNKCSIRKQPIALRLLQVKLDNKGQNALGEFKIESGKAGFNSLTLTESLQVLAGVFDANAIADLTIKFTPKTGIKAGEVKPEIVFQSTNQTSSIKEEITAILKTEVRLNDLIQCIEVIAPPQLLTEVAPFNLGYGLYNQFGLYPQAGLSNPSYAGIGGGISGLTGGGFSYSFPSASYTNPFYTRAFNTNADSNYSYSPGLSTFSIKNSCTVAVEIEIDSGPFVRTDKTKIEMEKGKEEIVQVQSGNRIGVFEVKVKGKRKQSQDSLKEIKKIPVIVRSLEEIGESCIRLSSTAFRFGYAGQPITEQIINSCYDVGVRLSPSQDVIKITCSLPGVQQAGRQFFSPEITIKASIVDVASLQAFGGSGYTYPGLQPRTDYTYRPGEFPVTGTGYNPSYAGSGYYGYNPNQNYYGGTTGQYYNPSLGTGYYNAPVYGSGNYDYLGGGRGLYYPSNYGAGYPGFGGAGYTGSTECPLIQSINVLDSRREGSTNLLSTQLPSINNEVVDFELIPAVNTMQPGSPFGAGAYPGYPGYPGAYGGYSGYPGAFPGAYPGFQQGYGAGFPGAYPGQQGYGGFPGSYPGGYPGAYPGYPGAQFPGGSLGIFPGQMFSLFNYFGSQVRAGERAKGTAHIKFISPAGNFGIERIAVSLEMPAMFFPGMFPPFVPPPFPPDRRDGEGGGGGGGDEDGGAEPPTGAPECIDRQAFNTVSYWARKGGSAGTTTQATTTGTATGAGTQPSTGAQTSTTAITAGSGVIRVPVISLSSPTAPATTGTSSTTSSAGTTDSKTSTTSTTQPSSTTATGFTALGFTPHNRFNNENITVWKPGEDPSDSRPLIFRGVPGCDAARIENLGVESGGEKDGVKVSFELKPDNRNIYMNVDRSKLTKKCTEVVTNVAFEVFVPIASPTMIQSFGGGFGGGAPGAPPTFAGGRFCGATTNIGQAAGLATLLIEEAKAKKGLRAEFANTAGWTATPCTKCGTGVWDVRAPNGSVIRVSNVNNAQAAILKAQQGYVTEPPTRPGGERYPPGYGGQIIPQQPYTGGPTTPPGQGFYPPGSNNLQTPPGSGFTGQYGFGQRNNIPYTLTATIRVYHPNTNPNTIKKMEDCDEKAEEEKEEPVKVGACEISNAHTDYGFDKLSFDWTWGTNAAEACNAKFRGIKRETGGVYDETKDGIKFVCDGTQFSSSILQMAEKVQKVTDEAVKKSTPTLKAITEFNTEIEKFDNSIDSWRFAKKQAVVSDKKDGTAEEKYLFFVRGNNIVLDKEKAKEFNTKYTPKKSGLELPVSTLANIPTVKNALKTIVDDTDLAPRIVGVYDYSGLSESANFKNLVEVPPRPIPEIYGAEKLGTTANYTGLENVKVITIKEFYNFWQKLAQPFEMEKSETEKGKHFTTVQPEKVLEIAKKFASNCSGVIAEAQLNDPNLTSEEKNEIKGKKFPLCHTPGTPENATVCWICNATDNGLVQVKKEFLEEFSQALKKSDVKTTETLGFKVGLRHLPTYPTSFKQSVLDADDIQEVKAELPTLSPSTGGVKDSTLMTSTEEQKFNEFYYRFIDFQAYLMEDKINEELRKQFAVKYTGKNALVSSYGTEWTTPNIEKTGRHALQLLYYTNGAKKKKDEHKKFNALIKDGTTVVPISSVDGKYGENVFMFLPFDGDLETRGDFGVAFENLSTTILGVSAKGSDDKPARLYKGTGQFTLGAKADTTEDKDKKPKVDLTKTATILTIDKDAKGFNFYPSKPVTFNLSLGAGDRLAFIYDLSDTDYPTSGVFSWRNKQTGQQRTERVVSRSEANQCKELKLEKSVHGFVSSETVTGRTYVGHGYIPTDVSEVNIMKALCAAPDPATLGPKTLPTSKNDVTSFDASGNVPVLKEQNSGRYIKEFIDLLIEEKDGTAWVCIKDPTKDKIELFWNTDKVTGIKYAGPEEPTKTTPSSKPTTTSTTTPQQQSTTTGGPTTAPTTTTSVRTTTSSAIALSVLPTVGAMELVQYGEENGETERIVGHDVIIKKGKILPESVTVVAGDKLFIFNHDRIGYRVKIVGSGLFVDVQPNGRNTVTIKNAGTYKLTIEKR